MQIPKDAVLLRIFIGESDRSGHRPLYEAIVLKARAIHLAGATVLRGPVGFGRSARLHTTKVLRLSQDLPIVIEIVDAEDRINTFLPELEKLMGKGSGLVTLEKAQVLRYGNGAPPGRT
jgi:uncharacterized protein